MLRMPGTIIEWLLVVLCVHGPLRARALSLADYRNGAQQAVLHSAGLVSILVRIAQTRGYHSRRRCHANHQHGRALCKSVINVHAQTQMGRCHPCSFLAVDIP